MHYRYALGGLVAVALVLAIYRSDFQANDHDILSMTRQIHQATTEIGRANAGILSSLSTVRQQVETVDTVQSRLATMEVLVNDQIAQLERLSSQIQLQAELGLEMQRVSAQMALPVEGLARTASHESELLGVMSGQSTSLAASLQAITAINRTIAQKLKRAEEIAALVLSRMP